MYLKEIHCGDCGVMLPSNKTALGGSIFRSAMGLPLRPHVPRATPHQQLREARVPEPDHFCLSWDSVSGDVCKGTPYQVGQALQKQFEPLLLHLPPSLSLHRCHLCIWSEGFIYLLLPLLLCLHGPSPSRPPTQLIQSCCLRLISPEMTNP